jgi:predicted AlkP superfamily pyrophosphatase or phosphodiesterase
MKKLYLFALLAFQAIHVFAQTHYHKHIVVIGIDGLGAKGVKEANTPVLDSLMKVGAYSLQAKSVIPTVSSPNWASILMGATPEEHGITSNAWKRKDIEEKTYCGGKKGETFPTIFKVIRQQYAEADLACFHDWDDFGRLVEQGVPSMIAATKGEDKTLIEAQSYILANKPLFTFIHLDHVDHAGHEFSWESKEYIKAVEKADSMIGQVVQSLSKAKIIEDVVLIIVSDHGGKGKGHGKLSIEELTIPFIIAGKGIKKNTEITQKVSNADVAPTIAYLLGCKVPSCWTGKAIREAVE